jgi:hypothetical protein
LKKRYWLYWKEYIFKDEEMKELNIKLKNLKSGDNYAIEGN